MRFEKVKEGAVTLKVPSENLGRAKGPGRKGGQPFYNPAMSVNRGLCVLLLRLCLPRFYHKRIRLLDPMASTAVRSLRIVKESIRPDRDFLGGRPVLLHVNDCNPKCGEIMRSNLKDVDEDPVDVEITAKDFNNLDFGRPYHYIDIDPFGTPVPFADRAVRMLARNGILGVTATDTACLFGTYPRVAKRRYMSYVPRLPYGYEVGLRTLLGYLIRTAAVHDTGMTPVLAYYQGHHVRAYLTKKRGAGNADQALSQLGYLLYNPDNGGTTVLKEGSVNQAMAFFLGQDKEDYLVAGPLYLGDLADRKLCNKMLRLARESPVYEDEASLLEGIKGDSEVQVPYYYRMDAMSKIYKSRARKMDKIIENLNDVGYNGVRSYFHPQAVRTEAPVDVVAEAGLTRD